MILVVVLVVKEEEWSIHFILWRIICQEDIIRVFGLQGIMDRLACFATKVSEYTVLTVTQPPAPTAYQPQESMALIVPYASPH